ncbi:hypothetical protein VTI74DRAFT_5709 [Chaetomium olivicolor]
MVSDTRNNRFPDHAGGPNGNASSQHGFGTIGAVSRWAFGDFGNPTASKGLSARETGRGTGGTGAGIFSDPSNLFTSAASGSRALAATSEADVWLPNSGPWNPPTNTHARPPSGNTSPQSRADTSLHELNGNSAHYAAGSNGAQRGRNGSRLPNGLNSSSVLNSSGTDDDSAWGVLAQMGVRPQTQQSAFLNNGGRGLPRDFGSSHDNSDRHAHANSVYGDSGYSDPSEAPSHSQRPSVSGLSFTTNSARSYDQHAGQYPDLELTASYLRNLDVSDGTNGPVGSSSNGYAYGGGLPSFRFNPGSRPWENGRGYGADSSSTLYANGTMFEPRGSIASRGSPSLSVYRASSALNSPRNFASTPHQSANASSRPVSRDPRAALDSDSRPMAQQFIQHSQAHLFQNGYFAPEFSPFQHLYGAVPDARQATPFTSGFGIPVPPFLLGAGAIPAAQTGEQDAWRGMRSEVLERIRRNSRSIKQLELKNLSGQISEICGDQAGSRFIQGRLESANSDEKEHVFHEIMPNAVQLMKCAFGNYVIQKLFEHGDQAHKKALARSMKGRVVELSTDKYACRVVQKALEYVLVDQQAELVKELEKDILNVVENVHGNHVVSQIIAVVPRQHIDFIMDCLKTRVQQLSCHQYACRVIQRALEHGTDEDKAEFMREVHKCGPALLSDPYGNYVAQHVIVNGSPEDHARMVNLVRSQLVALAKSQCGSHVVERCILHGTLEERRAMRDLLINSGEGADSLLFQLMKDQFGNYVIQKLANSLHGQDKDEMIEKMKPYLQRLRVAGATGKQISCMENLIRENTPSGTTSTTTETATHNTPAATPASTAPTSPGPALRLELNGDAPIPGLTNDPSSPLTPPSVTASNGDAAQKEEQGQGLVERESQGSFRPLSRGQVEV